MIGVERVKDRETRERAVEWRGALVRKAFNRGTASAGLRGKLIRFFPALTISPEEVDVGISSFEECVREVAHGRVHQDKFLAGHPRMLLAGIQGLEGRWIPARDKRE